MLFTTLPFAVFFVVVFVVHWVLPPPVRRPWLLVASYFFYMQALPQYGLLIGALTLVNYGFGLALGRRIEQTEHGMTRNSHGITRNKMLQTGGRTFLTVPGGQTSMSAPPLKPKFPCHSVHIPCHSVFRPCYRRALLILAIVANLGTLAFFKYAAFLLDAVWPLAQSVHPGAMEPALVIILPLGISFFTFEFIHYVVEVYRGQPPIRNPIDFALFAAFFPTQIAGPIKRFPDWVKQLKLPTRLRDVAADRALSLILRGMAKKILVADLLSPVVAQSFARPDRLGFVTTWLAIYAFAAQIYADFSGYTDIGRGCAMLLGYSVPENFNSPYQARNPSEFWDRWHISLSTWLRDYLYIPLGGSRRALPRVCLNLLITMALGGLWHGAEWHFMLWGAYQGALLVVYRLWTRFKTIKSPLSIRRWGRFRRARAPGARSPRLGKDAHKGLERASVADMSAIRSASRVLLGQIVTFHLVCLGWVFFRADTGPLAQTLIFSALHPMRHNFWAGFQWFAPGTLALPGVVLAGAALLVLHGWLGTWLAASSMHCRTLAARVALWHARWEPHLRPALQLALLLLIAIWPQGTAQRFIYFQF